MQDERNQAPNSETEPKDPYKFVFIDPKLIRSAAETVKQQQEDLQELIERAEDDDLEAKHQLALCYYRGTGGAKQDYEKAFYWFQQAAEQGDVSAVQFRRVL